MLGPDVRDHRSGVRLSVLAAGQVIGHPGNSVTDRLASSPKALGQALLGPTGNGISERAVVVKIVSP